MNRNADIKQEILNSQRLQTALGDVIQEPIPVIEVNPKLTKNLLTKSQQSSNLNGNATLIAASTTKDYYLYGAVLTLDKDSTADTVGCSINYTNEKTVSEKLNQIGGITLTAKSAVSNIMLSKPIKIARNTAVVLNSNRTAGTSYIGCILFYQEEDNLGN